MKIKPIGDRVLVKPMKVEEKTASGLILPTISEKNYKNRGEVVALGKGDIVSEIKIGNIIIFEEGKGTICEQDEIKYTIIEAKDILAILE
jgi:chaperonin GroES